MTEVSNSKIDDYTWHHHQDFGVMQLVRTDIHKLAPHTGGVSIWQRAFRMEYDKPR
ncbi:MAG: HNH endonuclease [Burkholderiaceae bacterium]|nr:HNH endonuclease [Burkholderiaceae bacterium]